jgi:hypothetical protein
MHALEAAAARHVHRVGGNLLRDPGAIGDLPGDVGTAAGLSRAAEDDFVDLGRCCARAGQGLARHGRSELGRAHARERAAEFADGRPHRPRHDDFVHSSRFSKEGRPMPGEQDRKGPGQAESTRRRMISDKPRRHGVAENGSGVAGA